MKNNLLLLAIVTGVLSTSLYAKTEPGYQPATVVSVESQATPSNNDGGDPSDAPLQSVVNSYDIDIRLGVPSTGPAITLLSTTCRQSSALIIRSRST